MIDYNGKLIPIYRIPLPTYLSVFIIFSGSMALIGWHFDLPLLTSLRSSYSPLNPISALAFILAGLSLYLTDTTARVRVFTTKRLVALGCASLIALIGLAKFIEYYTNWSIGVDQWLYPTKLEQVLLSAPNHIALTTAFNLILSGIALVCINSSQDRGYALAVIPVIGITSTAFIALIGYIYNIASFGGIVPMAFTSAYLFIMLGIGILWLFPDRGLLGVLLSRNLGGRISRNFLPVAILLPLIIGWLCLGLQDRMTFNYELVVGAAMILIIYAFSVLIYLNSRSLGKVDDDRRFAHNELIEQKRFLEAISAATPDIVYVLDLRTGKKTYSNKDTDDWFGCRIENKEQINQFDWITRFVHLDDLDMLLQHTSSLSEAADQEVSVIEFRVKTSDGIEKWLSNRTVVFSRDAEGKVTHVLGWLEDTSQRREDEVKIADLLKGTQSINEELIANEEELRQTLDQTLELNDVISKSKSRLAEAQRLTKLGHWEWDITTGTTVWSDQLYRNYGLEPQALKPNQQTFYSVIHPDDLVNVREMMDAILKRNEQHVGEFRIVWPTGEVRNILSLGSFVLNEQGEIIKVFGTHQDITERKQAEERISELLKEAQTANEELSESREELYQTLTQTLELNEKLSENRAKLAETQRIARLGSWEYNLITNQAVWSIEMYRIFGLNPNLPPLSDDEYLNCVHHEDLERFQQERATALQLGKPYELEMRILNNGQARWVFVIGKPMYNEKGEVIKVIGIILDITERKLAELQLTEQNKELRKINSELDRFVYRASHDLRAPLSSLLGLINIAKIEADEEAKMRYFALMIKSVDKLDTFIQGIISYSRNARLEVNSQPIDIKEMVWETFDDLKYMPRCEEIEKKLDISGDREFFSDAFRLKIIFSNIISNAIRYSNPRVASFIHIDIKIEEENTLIRFIDNGYGIAAESIDKIFEMFYRASESSAGSGLGLYIVKEVVQTLEGEIKVDSEIGIGTTFQITLPHLR